MYLPTCLAINRNDHTDSCQPVLQPTETITRTAVNRSCNQQRGKKRPTSLAVKRNMWLTWPKAPTIQQNLKDLQNGLAINRNDHRNRSCTQQKRSHGQLSTSLAINKGNHGQLSTSLAINKGKHGQLSTSLAINRKETTDSCQPVF